MQHNVIPVAEAKGFGIIGMKTFADAAMYHKEPRWSHQPEDVYRKVGEPGLPSRPLIEYSLTTPGVHTLIIGIGQIDEDPMKCQLTQNFYAAQIAPNGLTAEERLKTEQMAAAVKEGKTNYFQLPKAGLTAPRDLQKTEKDGQALLSWQTAYAGDYPLARYEIMVDGEKKGEVPHKPQTLKKEPFVFAAPGLTGKISVVSIDAGGNRAEAVFV
jgi:hypothetical protein